MTWTPAEVRACDLHEFHAAFDGWLISQGVEPEGDGPDPDALDDLMRRYPDG